jgi:hypothetical protein
VRAVGGRGQRGEVKMVRKRPWHHIRALRSRETNMTHNTSASHGVRRRGVVMMNVYDHLTIIIIMAPAIM